MGEGGGAVADLGLVKGGFKSENQKKKFSLTHYWFNTPLYSSQQQGKAQNLHSLFYMHNIKT